MTEPRTVLSDVSVWSGSRWQVADVVLEGGLVAALEPRPGGTGGGGYVLPGFVSTHTHLQQSLMRGTAEGVPLLEWLLAVAETSVAITPERAYLATVAACLEALRSGTTTVVEHMWPHPSTAVHEAVLRGLGDTGIRCVLGRGVADRPDATRRWGFEPRLLQPLDDVLDHVDALRAAAPPRVTLSLAVPNPRSLTPEGMAHVRSFADDRGLGAMIHLLETTTDDVMCRENTGRGAVEHLDDHGFLWDRLLAVHCVELDEHGRRVLAERGVAVSYNPVSNMRLGSGVAPVPAMLEAGIAVGLGVDGAASNDTQDMFETLRIGAYVQRAVARRADLFSAAAMLELATTGANTVLGLPPSPGGVTVGNPADLSVLRFDRDWACLPVRDPGASLLTTGSRALVEAVYVDGEAVVRDGVSTRVDEEHLLEQLSAL
jgi:5-methylthioadenosine/S-adenosylhomocysteine deaminase